LRSGLHRSVRHRPDEPSPTRGHRESHMAALPRGAYCHFSNSSSSSAVALLTWELLTSFSKIDIPGPIQSSPLSQKNLHGLGHRITVFLADHVGSCSFVVKRTIHYDPDLSRSLPGHRVIYGCLLDSDELVASFSSSSAAIIILPVWPGLGLAWINYRKNHTPDCHCMVTAYAI
jgi:hypothetical protein